MANIALLNRCNLRCPYCFAENYIADEKTDITIDTFGELLDFCASDGEVGIIGGEPLLHKDFAKIMEMALSDPRISRVTLFTNGVFLDKHMGVLDHPLLSILVNVNSKKDIGENSFNKIDQNIGALLERRAMCKISLGINVY